MADITDVETALVNLIAGALYPNGTGQASAAGVPVVIYPGWPTASRLDADLIAGKSHVTVFQTALERNTTRYPRDWHQQAVNVATLTLTTDGQSVTVGGAMPAPFTPHVLNLMVNGVPHPYQVLAIDTLGSIAAALAALVAVDVPGTAAAGAVITLPAGARINAARVGVTGTAIRELRRQERGFRISVWSDTPEHRVAVAGLIDVALAAVDRLTMPDGFSARVIYHTSMDVDSQQKAKLYRRDFVYSVEYATTQMETQMQITQEQLNASGQIDGSTEYGPVKTTYF
jgi:hypothetical protein